MNDTNWIFSSIIQATAAFVAIVSGFITGSVLQLVAKRNGVDDEIAETEVELGRVRALHASAVLARDRFIVRTKIDEETERIIENGSLFQSTELAQKNLDLMDVTQEAFDIEWSEFDGRLARMRRIIDHWIESYGAKKAFFEDWLSARKLDTSFAESWESELIYRHSREIWLYNRSYEGGVRHG